MENENINSILNTFLGEENDNKITKARILLGIKAQNMNDKEIEHVITDFEYLITHWLDNFEKEIFNGKTLHEVTVNG